ncbi:anti-sigma regulatory factor (Ser/Thr protein kinase) [Streptacidiphilus sp. MAP12-20]|uniref:ATP-binding protein n=1 Tax=Streptacidiphilus sp. MAP12-20 TaxID=3156299 RepID=UPI003515199C
MEDLDRHYELRLTAEPCRFGVVRRIVQAHLRHWNLTAVTDQTLLGLTELLANVHQHVGPAARCTLRLHAGADALTVEVSDSSPELPQAHCPEPLDAGGRGLTIVAGLCKEWGAQPDGDGKTVWFTVATAPVQAPALLQPVPLALEVDALELEAVLAD